MLLITKNTSRIRRVTSQKHDRKAQNLLYYAWSYRMNLFKFQKHSLHLTVQTTAKFSKGRLRFLTVTLTHYLVLADYGHFWGEIM